MSPARQRKTWILAAAGLAAFGLLTGFDPEGLPRHRRLQLEAVRLAAENAALSAENSRLAAEARALRTDPAALERAAREELRLVRPGEIIYRLDAQAGGTP